MVRIFIADDHPGYRLGIRQYFENRPDALVVGEAGDGATCLAQLRVHRPDWAIIDLAMPGLSGFEVLVKLHDSGTATRIIIMSMHAEMAYAEKARELGASAYIAKEDAVSVLDFALAAKVGEFYLSPSVGRVAATNIRLPGDSEIDRLTRTETSILRLLASGMTSKEIARKLEISPRTVQAHRRNMSEKLGLHGPNRLLEFAVRNSSHFA